MPYVLFFLRVFVIGACALAMVAQTRTLLGLPLSMNSLDAFVFGGTLFGYHCAHGDWRFRALAWFFGVFGGVGLLYWIDSVAAFCIVLLPVVFWLAYYGFQRPGQVGLRDGLVAKPLTVAFAWAWVTVLMPLPMEAWAEVWPMFLARAAFVFALALAYDWSDSAFDRRTGFKTLAMLLEEKGTSSLINLGLGAAAFFVWVGWSTGVYRLPAVFSLLGSLLFSAFWLPFVLKKEDWQPWHKVQIDALMLFQGSLVLLLR